MAPISSDKKSDDRLVIQYDKAGFVPHLRVIQENLKVAFPLLPITTEVYPLTTRNQFFVNLIFFIQIAMTALFMFGKIALDYLKIDLDPTHVKYFEQNKFMVVPAMLMLSPIRQLISKTGAFEVYLNDELIFSTLNSKTLPNFESLENDIAKKGIKAAK